MATIQHYMSGQAASPICLVFIHGMLCDHSNWLPQMQHFESQYQVLSLDLPGHGASTFNVKQSWDVVSIAGALKTLLLDLNLGKQLIIIAHSASVRIALELNYLMDNQLTGLVLIDCGYQHIARPNMHQWITDLRQIGYVTWLTQFFTSKFGVNSAVLRDKMLHHALRLDPVMGESLYLAVKTYDYYTLEKCLKLTTIPVLVMQALLYKGGILQSTSAGRKVESDWISLVNLNLPKAQIKVIPNCGHWIMLQQPDLCNTGIGDFVQHITHAPVKKRATRSKEKPKPFHNFNLPFE